MRRKKRNKSTDENKAQATADMKRFSLEQTRNFVIHNNGVGRSQTRAAASISIRSCHSLVVATFLSLILALAAAAATGSDPRHSHQSQIVFPGPSDQPPSGNQRPRPQQQIYINPQPSTLSGKYQTAFQHHHRQRPHLAPAFGQAGGSYQPPITRAPASSGHLQQAASVLSESASSIGKSEKSQVAEWPFFKSFQTIKNNQLSNQLVQKAPQTSTTTTSMPIDGSESSSLSPPEGPADSATMSELDDGPTPLDSAATYQESQASTSPASPTIIDATSTTTTTTTPTTSGNAENSVADEGSEREMMRQLDKVVMNRRPQAEVPAAHQAPTTTSSTVAPNAQTPASANTIPSDLADQMLLMAPKMHSSIQGAVNQLVELGATKAAANKTSRPVSSLKEDQRNAPTVMRLNGNSQGLKSSLSLNVLLKNFGAFNLSSLDQILLKSSLNQPETKNSSSKVLDQGQLSINGLHHVEPKRFQSSLDESNSKLLNDNDEQAAAECKIEYTMQHVNITLMNDDKSDYTCDYIIDRKLSRDDSKGPVTFVNMSNICRLQLTSDLFSNDSTGDSLNERRDDSTTCSGSTYLAIGPMRFCLLESSSSPGLSLNRVFNFPIEREAFDIKLVHKQSSADRTSLLKEQDKRQQVGEIRLEIRPLVDDGCGRKQAMESNNEQVSSSSSSPSASATTTARPATLSIGRSSTGPSMSREIAAKPRQNPTPDASQSTSRAPTGENVENQTGSRPSQSFVLKMAPDQQVHPLNQHRFRSQQSTISAASSQKSNQFEPETSTQKSVRDRESKESGGRSADELARAKPMFRLTPVDKQRKQQASFVAVPDQLDTCHPDTLHISTIGQIQTPNYPNNYTANMRCRHVVKRVSHDHCKLLLNFRDFDLVPRSASSSSEEANGGNNNTPTEVSSNQPKDQMDETCSGDYLLIGETRYCNKYAMTGHKMYLNFSEASTSELQDEAIALTFVSDSQTSGRGVLIKYQQLPCDDLADERTRTNPTSPLQRPRDQFKSPANLLTNDQRPDQSTGVGGGGGQAKLHTLAPPIQQPDFSLALKSANNQTGSGQQDSSTGSASRGARAKVAVMGGGQDKAKQRQSVSSELRLNGESSSSASPSQRSQRAQVGLLQMASSSTVPSSNLLLLDTPTTTTSTGGSESSPSCNQVHHEMSFLLASQNYPSPYDNNLACTYFIRRNSSQVCYLELTFLRFDLEADSDCRYDSLEINNVRLCGSLRHETTRIYLFEETVKLIKFKSDSSTSKAGFLIKAEQLECAPDGSILRNSPGGAAAAGNLTNGSQSSNSSAPVIEYDSVLGQSKPTAASTTGRPSLLTTDQKDSSSIFAGRARQLGLSGGNLTSWQRRYDEQQSGGPGGGSQQTARQCDYLLHGSDITIRSPMWPESYAADELLSSCRYTILRQNFGQKKNSICQLELRFVHLRLGPGDCLDIDGMELLCSFNARNLVKYYPFNERQTHLTITFTTASGSAKLFSARAATPPYQHLATLQQRQQQRDQLQQNHSDLLPTLRGPLRFMILARQLECIDDFLAPQVDLDQSTRSQNNQQLVNTTNLLYTEEPASGPLRAPVLRPRYVNRTTGMLPAVTPTSSLLAAAKPALVQPSQKTRLANDSQLSYDQSLTPIADLEPIRAKAPAGAKQANAAGAGQLMYSFADSVLQNYTKTRFGSSSSSCLVQFNQYNGILASSNILRARAESQLAATSSTASSVELGSSSKLVPTPSECEIRLKLLPGFCKVQLTFGEFDLYPSRLGGSLCLGEYLELAGVQYCGHELRGATRVLTTTLPGQRHISLRAIQASQNSFRAIYKQLECDSANFNGASNNQTTTISATGSSSPSAEVATTEPATGANSAVSGETSKNSIEFREIVLREEFFELDSAKLAKQTRLFYEPNLFIVYKLKRAHSSVCKLRLMFYKFDLEQPDRFAPNGTSGCKRDFLDINNQDRLCGSMDFRLEEASREYDWPSSSRDFQISFVTDSTNERTGFQLFGQQVRCNNRSQADSRQVAAEADRSKSSESLQSQRQQPQHEPQATPLKSSGQQKSTSSADAETGGKQSNEEGERGQLPANCSQIIDGLQFELASPNWPERYEGIGSCHYLVRRAKPDICSLTLRVNSMILDVQPAGRGSGEEAACSARGQNSEDQLDLDQEVQLCGLMTRPKSYKFHFTNSTVERQFIVVKFVSNVAHGFGFLIEGRQNACADRGQGQPSEEFGKQAVNLASTSRQSDRSQSEHKDQENSEQPVYQISYNDNPRQRDGSTGGGARADTQKHAQSDGPEMGSGDNNNRQPATTTTTTKRPQTGGQVSCNRLLTGPFNLVESENFPSAYANNLDCLYAVRRLNKSVCALDLIFNYFDLEPPSGGAIASQEVADPDSGGRAYEVPASGAGQAQCDTDYLEIDHSRFCGAYPNQHKVRFNYFEHEHDKIVRFRSDGARTRIGFSIGISQVMGDEECGANSDNAQQQPQQQPTQTRKPHQDNEREVISYLPDSTSSSSMVAPNNGSGLSDGPADLGGRKEQQVTASLSEQRQPSSTVCQFSYANERQLLVSPGYNAQRRHYDNNLHCLYKIIATSYDICSLRLAIVDLELEQSVDCLNDYLLIDNKRYCGQWTNQSRKSVIELEFDSNLPREIDLILHTDSHSNAGRGFKILAEQLACDTPIRTPPSRPASGRDGDDSSGGADQEFKLAAVAGSELDGEAVAKARQLHRMRFGQLTYPKNYVSSPAVEHRGGVARSGRAQTLGQDLGGQNEELSGSGRQSAAHSSSRQPPQSLNSERGEFMTISSDDLKLSKEIVVSRTGLTTAAGSKPNSVR